MTFLKWSMLLGIAALAIPIVIHLLNRSKPRPIEWGAMQFLLAAMTARRRRVQIEDGILLCIRCLVLALLALAMARPFLPSMAAVPWVLVLPGLLIAAVCAGMAAVLRSQERLRRRLIGLGIVLLAAAVLASLLEHWIQARRWLTATGGRDTAIVLDASLSMTLATGGRTAFSRAVEEAGILMASGRAGDAYAVILGGPTPQPLVRRPTSDRDELKRVLQAPDCKPAGGVMAVIEAMNLAATLLADGPNAAKEVVVFTDGQAAGWDARSEARWKFVAENFKALPTTPRITVRRLPRPDSFRNAAVQDIRLSRAAIGTDRPVKIDVTVANTGDTPVQSASIELTVDDTPAGSASILKDLLPQTAEGFPFEFHFATPGYHVVKAKIVTDDDLPADNALERVVHVLDHLPVLLVEGAGAERFFFRRTSNLMRMALTPRETAADRDAASPEIPDLIVPTVVEAAGLAAVTDFSAYRVVILADVPRLPGAIAERLVAFVKAGGGLLVAPGARAEPSFYNNWQAPSGEPVLPAALGQRATPGEPLRLDLKSFTHPALQLIADPAQSDARFGLVYACWKLDPDIRSPLVRVGGLLESKDPWIVERQLGRGFTLMTPLAFDRRDSNLSAMKCFVPMVHEMVYYLAAPMLVDSNIKPGTEWVLAGRLPSSPATAPDRGAISVLTPSGAARPADFQEIGRRFVVRFSETRQSGLYRLRVPEMLAAASGAGTNGPPEILFTVRNQPEESALDALGDADFAAIRRHADLFRPDSLEDLLTAFAGKTPGQEWWKWLVLCALLFLIAETALTRWIAVQRQLHRAEPVKLNSPAEGVQAMKARFEELVGGAGHGS